MMLFYEITSTEMNFKLMKKMRTERVMNIISQLVMFLSVICFTLGVIEVSKAGKECQNIVYNISISQNHPLLVSRVQNVKENCYEQKTYGQGIWCSFLPFVTGVFGATFTSKPRKFIKVNHIILLCVISSILTQTMALLSIKLLSKRRNYFRVTQIIQICSSEIICAFLTLIASLTQRIKLNVERYATSNTEQQIQDNLPSYRELADMGSFTIQLTCEESDESFNKIKNNKTQEPPVYSE